MLGARCATMSVGARWAFGSQGEGGGGDCVCVWGGGGGGGGAGGTESNLVATMDLKGTKQNLMANLNHAKKLSPTAGQHSPTSPLG